MKRLPRKLFLMRRSEQRQFAIEAAQYHDHNSLEKAVPCSDCGHRRDSHMFGGDECSDCRCRRFVEPSGETATEKLLAASIERVKKGA